jgi:large subunit ribosomal protein L10
MAVSKAKKEEVIAELTDLFKNSKSVVFSDYQGISVKDVQTLRRNLRDNDSTFKVAKKTLIKLAAKDAGFDEIPEEALEGQVGVAFSMSDEIAAAKTLYDFSKTNDAVKLLSAFMEGKTLSKEETLELAKIPGKDELLAKLVGSMKSPISGFHGVLYSLLRSFVGVVDAYKDSKPAEEAQKEEAKAEEPKAEEKPAEEPKEEAKTEEPAAEEKAEEEAKADEPAEEKPAEEDNK